MAALLISLVPMPGALAASHTKTQTILGAQVEPIASNCLVSAKVTSDGVYEQRDYKIKLCSDPAEYPPTGVHLLRNTNVNSGELAIMLAGTGLDFNTNFEQGNNPARMIADSGYWVVGIDARETNIAYDPIGNYGYMNTMDTAQHTSDVRMVVKFAQIQTGIRDYVVIGHSLGARLSLGYAAEYNKDPNLKGIGVIDAIGTFDPNLEPRMAQMARDSYNETDQLIQSGQSVNLGMLGFAQLAANAQIDPNGDSGMPNPFVPGSNLTNLQMLYVAGIYTNQLPGNWYYVQGFFAGDIVNGFYHTPLELVYRIGQRGTIYPLSVDKDDYSLLGNIGSYKIDYQNIKVPVVWYNSELGFGNRPYVANLIRQSGNQNVIFRVVPEYGHADLVYSQTARQDFWNEFVADLRSV